MPLQLQVILSLKHMSLSLNEAGIYRKRGGFSFEIPLSWADKCQDEAAYVSQQFLLGAKFSIVRIKEALLCVFGFEYCNYFLHTRKKF